MIDQVNEVSLSWGELILRASWQGAILALVAWSICRAWKKMPPVIGCGIWLVVFLKLAISVMPFALALPLLPAKQALPPVLDSVEPSGLVDLTGFVAPAPQLSIQSYALGIWGLGVILLVGIAFVALLRLRKKVRESGSLGDSELIALVDDLSARIGLRKPPRVVVSERESGPMTIGIARPVILIPQSTLDNCSREELSFILAHELAHIKRGDAWLALLPQMVSAIFFFHPAVWIANREFELSREAACDQIAVRTLGASQDAYGRLLLKLSSPREDTNPPFVFGISSHFRILARRISMLKETSTLKPSRRPLYVLALAGVLLAMPWTLVNADPAPAPTKAAIQPEPTVLPEPPQSSKPKKTQKPKTKPNIKVNRTQSFVVELKYAKAESVKAEVLKRAKLKNTALVTDSRKNQIVVVGFLPESEETARLIRSLDKKPSEKPQIVNEEKPWLMYKTEDPVAIAVADQTRSELVYKFGADKVKVTVDPSRSMLRIQGSEAVIRDAVEIQSRHMDSYQANPQTTTTQIHIQHVNAMDVAKKVNEDAASQLPRGSYRLLVDPAKNSLVVEAKPEALSKIKALVSKHDVKANTKADEPSRVLRRFRLEGKDGERVLRLLKEALPKSGIDFASYDPTDNSIIIRAYETEMNEIHKYIGMLDNKPEKNSGG